MSDRRTEPDLGTLEWRTLLGNHDHSAEKVAAVPGGWILASLRDEMTFAHTLIPDHSHTWPAARKAFGLTCGAPLLAARQDYSEHRDGKLVPVTGGRKARYDGTCTLPACHDGECGTEETS